jgi:hypothetical protein
MSEEHVPSQSTSNTDEDPVVHIMRLVRQAYEKNNAATKDRINDCESAYRAVQWGIRLVRECPEEKRSLVAAQFRRFLIKHNSPPLTRERIQEILQHKESGERRRLISRILHFLKLEDRLPPEELDSLRGFVNSFLPPIDEAWIEKKIDNTADNDLPKLTQTIFGIIAYEARFSPQDKEKLREYFANHIRPRLGETQTNELVKRHTFSVPLKETFDVEHILTYRAPPRSQPVTLKQVRVPSPPPPRSIPNTSPVANPIAVCEGEIRQFKSRRNELQRALNDGTAEDTRATRQQLDELNEQLSAAQQKREALLRAKTSSKKKIKAA